MEKNHVEGCWISLLLRIAIASLLATAAIGKFAGGLDGVVGYFQAMFKETWLPMPLVTLQARMAPFLEVLLPAWLLIGFRLRWAWIVTTLFMISLAFGMVVAQKYDVAANNYFYVLVCCAGLYFSQFDRLNIGGCQKKE